MFVSCISSTWLGALLFHVLLVAYLARCLIVLYCWPKALFLQSVSLTKCLMLNVTAVGQSPYSYSQHSPVWLLCILWVVFKLNPKLVRDYKACVLCECKNLCGPSEETGSSFHTEMKDLIIL